MEPGLEHIIRGLEAVRTSSDLLDIDENVRTWQVDVITSYANKSIGGLARVKGYVNKEVRNLAITGKQTRCNTSSKHTTSK